MLNRAHALAAKQIGKNPFHHPAVGQHEGRPEPTIVLLSPGVFNSA